MVLAKKSLGQNFLMHRQTAERIVGAALLPENAQVLEIGPGTGMLTKELLAVGHQVIAVEADDVLIPELTETFGGAMSEDRLTLLHDDIRSFDTETIKGSYHVVANIPYYITGELIRQFLTAPHQPESMTLLVQKEVAERIARSKKESLLSLSVKVFGTPEYRFTVPRGAFRPAPNVDSAVLRISHINRSRFATPNDESVFFEVIRAGFAHKRKQLGKNLEEIWSKEKVGEACDAAHIKTTVRAEDLSLETWLTLTSILKSS